MAKVISVQVFMVQVCNELGLNQDRTKRIIIDLDAENCREPIPVYVEMIGDSRILALNWSKELERVEIVRESKGEAEP